MSYNCTLCGKYAGKDYRIRKIITKVREVSYVYSKEANGKIFTGTEIVEESNVCEDCENRYKNIAPQVVEKTKKVMVENKTKKQRSKKQFRAERMENEEYN